MADKRLARRCASGCAGLALFLSTVGLAEANVREPALDAAIRNPAIQRSSRCPASYDSTQPSMELAGGFLGGFGINQLGASGGPQRSSMGPYYPPNYGAGYPATSGMYSTSPYSVRSRVPPARHDTAHGGAGANAYGYSYYNYYNGTWNGYRYRPPNGLGTYRQGSSGLLFTPSR